jgi:outer membrane protein TolC
MGVSPSTVIDRPLLDVGATEAPAAVEAGVPETHPDLVRAREVEQAAERRLDERRAGRLPRLDLSAGLLDYGSTTGRHVAEWQAGIAVSWPLFTGGARSASIRRAEADLEAAREEREVARRALDSSEDEARAALAASDARVRALAASVVQWEEVARIEALALTTGAGVQSDLLSAEASLFRARAGLAQARAERLLARVRLARTSGTLDLEWLERTLEEGR